MRTFEEWLDEVFVTDSEGKEYPHRLYFPDSGESAHYFERIVYERLMKEFTNV